MDELPSNPEVNNVTFGLGFEDFWINCLDASSGNDESPALSISLRSHQLEFDTIVDNGA